MQFRVDFLNIELSFVMPSGYLEFSRVIERKPFPHMRAPAPAPVPVPVPGSGSGLGLGLLDSGSDLSLSSLPGLILF